MRNEHLSLNVLAFGSQIMLSRLNDLLETEDINIYGFSDPLKTLDLLGNVSFDLIIVENQAVNAEAVLRTTFCFAEAPVAILLQESAADWRKLRNLPVDGYLPDGVSKTEFIARLRALIRRRPIYHRLLSPNMRN
jgi:DNA-binding response OmpR family regulator